MSTSKGHLRDRPPLDVFAFHQVDRTAAELLSDDGAAGRIRRKTRPTSADSTSVKERERERERERWGLPCAQLIHPILSRDTDKSRMDEMMEGRRLIVKSRRSLENWRCRAERGTLHLLLKKGEERRMCWRDKGARARICLISGDVFPSSCAPCLYAV